MAAWSGNIDILYKRVKCLEKTLGPEHTETIRALSELAALLQASGKFEEAQPLVRRVLAHEQATVISPRHMVKRDPRDFSRCLGKVISDLDGQAEAETRLRRIHSGCQQILGPNHSYTFTALVDLAMLLRVTGKTDEAEPLLGSVLDSEEVSNCFDTLTVLKAMNCLAIMRAESGKCKSVEGLLQRALALAIEGLEPSHPNIWQAFMDLSALQRALGAEDQAKLTLVRAVNHCESLLGPNHDCTVSALAALAVNENSLGNFSASEKLLRQVVDIQQMKWGDAHPETVTVVKYLAVLLNARSRQEEATQLLESINNEEEEVEEEAIDLQLNGQWRFAPAVSSRDVWLQAVAKHVKHL